MIRSIKGNILQIQHTINYNYQLIEHFYNFLQENKFFIFPLYSITNEICTCYAGKQCTSPGKHPLYKNWKSVALKATSDNQFSWLKCENNNVAVLTGSFSEKNKKFLTIIDIDNPKQEILNLSNISKNIFLIDICGKNGYAIISLSIHITGNRYSFDDDKNIDNKFYNITDLPENIINKLISNF